MNALTLPAPAPLLTAGWPGELAHHVADEILAWCRWHGERAAARGLDASALEAVAAAAADAAFAIEAGEDSDEVRAVLHAAIDEAKAQADARRPRDAAGLAQSIEMETSFLRGWARALDDVAIIADSGDAAGHMQALQALTFHAPPRCSAAVEMTE